MPRAHHVLVIEDHPKVADSIRTGLVLEGFEVRSAASGDEGAALACRGTFDAVVLDLMLPGRSGLEILADMRRQHVETPVLLHLFDRFYRADDARSHVVGGAGLGLAMARWAVEVHGGTIGVRSDPGAGSVFHISLPAV